jgi:hypothetical protein
MSYMGCTKENRFQPILSIMIKRIKNIGILMVLAISFLTLLINCKGAPEGKQMYYEIKIYRISGPSQEARMDDFLQNAFIPAMHRAGISTVGVFKPIENDTAFGKLVYLFIPYKTVEQFFEQGVTLEQDPEYQNSAKDFLDASYNDPPFIRYETLLLKAFTNMPEFRIPSFTTPRSERIYELRSYESATEAMATKKIQMFNEGGEMGIFEKIGANAVFYGKVIMGNQMPRLMYLTTYANMKSHDDCWAAFFNHPDWKTLSSLEEYSNTVSIANPYLLHPTSYSDF